MATCPICDKPLACVNSGDERHKQAVGGAAQDCPPKKGAIWVQVLDEKRGGVLKAAVNIAGKAAETDDTGFGYSDPLAEGTYDVELKEPIPDAYKDTHLLPDTVKLKATVRAGEITLVKFRLEKINIVTPKIEVEYKVVLLDRGLAAHQTGEPEADKIYADPTRIEVSLEETNREEHPFKTTAKLKVANVEVFRDEDCKTKLTEDLKAEEIAGGKTLKLWLRGKTAGKFNAEVEIPDPGDRFIKPKTAPPVEMGVVEIIMEVRQHDVAAVKALQVDPDTEPISTYHTNLKDKALPEQKAMTDEQKVKIGRLLHEQKDSNHGRAKLVLKKLVSAQWPGGTDDYEIYINRSNKSGAVELFDAEWDGAVKSFPAGPFKVSELKAADKEYWAEGKSACKALRDVRLDVSLDRAEGGLDKDVKRNADWARFHAVKIKEVKLDYKAEAGKPDPWDEPEKRWFINLKSDPDGRKITIGAQLSEEIKDIVVHFMLIEHKDNRKTANWGINLPDGTRALTPTRVKNDAGASVTLGRTEPKWTWKDIAAAVKHLDKDDRKNILHYSEKTDDKGYAKKEVQLSRFGGDKFYLAAYIEQDPHLCKYIDGHTDLSKRKPVMMTDPIAVWRKFWYKEVKVAGLLVSDFRDAPETYKDVKAVMAAGTVVEMPRATANGISPKVIYPKHMVSYYVSGGRYRNNYPGDTGDALVVGDNNEARFFSLCRKEADKPVMYPMMNAHALWVPGGTSGVANSVGPHTHPWATPDDFNNNRVSITTSAELLDPPLQGGNLLSRGKWYAEDWVLHADPTTASGPDAPAGAAPGAWGNARDGDLAATDVSLDPNRSDPRAVRVTLPPAITLATHTRIRIDGLHVRCAQSFLGTSYRDGIVNAFTPNDLQDFVNTVNHETGHSFEQVIQTRPGNAPSHPLKYSNQGSHCGYDGKKCVMYESGPQPGSLNRYCPVCHTYLLVADMSTVRGNLT